MAKPYSKEAPTTQLLRGNVRRYELEKITIRKVISKKFAVNVTVGNYEN
jgi:hypothetical protein